MRHAVEEVGSIRYMLRCLDVHVENVSHVYGDNLGVIQNTTIKDSLLKKKHVAISYQKLRETVSAGVIVPIKIASANNFRYFLTKALPIGDQNRLVNGLFYGSFEPWECVGFNTTFDKYEWPVLLCFLNLIYDLELFPVLSSHNMQVPDQE